MARVIRCSNFFNSIRNNLVIQESMEYTLDRILQCRALLQRKNQFHVQIYTAMHTYKTYSILLNFALLCFIDVAFLQIEGKKIMTRLLQNQTSNISKVLSVHIYVSYTCVCVYVQLASLQSTLSSYPILTCSLRPVSFPRFPRQQMLP